MGERDASRWAHCVTDIVVPNSFSAEGGLDTAKSILEQDVDDLVKRTDLEEETILEVIRILKEEFED